MVESKTEVEIMLFEEMYKNMYDTMSKDDFLWEMRYRKDKYNSLKNKALVATILANVILFPLDSFTGICAGMSWIFLLMYVAAFIFGSMDMIWATAFLVFGGIFELLTGPVGIVFSIPAFICAGLYCYAVLHLQAADFYESIVMNRNNSERMRKLGVEDSVITEVKDFEER